MATRAAHITATIEAAMRAVGNAVDEAELAGVISQSTGIPVSTMLGDSEKVLYCCCCCFYRCVKSLLLIFAWVECLFAANCICFYCARQ